MSLRSGFLGGKYQFSGRSFLSFLPFLPFLRFLFREAHPHMAVPGIHVDDLASDSGREIRA